MKQYLLPSLFLAASVSFAGVPSEINYQGRLTDANGDAVTGEVSMSLKMFDAATDGNELYSEDIGTVTLDDNGVYSFSFGASGQSVVATSESITSTDGVNQVFNATLANLPVDGSVSLSDGTYTWSQVNGSSSAADFTASVTPASGAVSAIYLSGAPTAGVEITATYDYLDASVVGALSSHSSHWLELSVDGSAQSPRERVLSVPFAQVAGTAEKNIVERKLPCLSNWWVVDTNGNGYAKFYNLPRSTQEYYSYYHSLHFDSSVRSIDQIRVQYKRNTTYYDATLKLFSKSSQGSEVLATFEMSEPSSDVDVEINLTSSVPISINAEENNYYLLATGSGRFGDGVSIMSVELILSCEE